ncbi:MAG: hypothetical protein A2745_01075 [Candidatus Harrisonbacteria bacterium RIFCSPHIGHO2_01_FULL_44_13]|uniref:Uncharacterized protein n=1 Tax=Candidatus Harrisonbacteria bacterium RIFCSPLOWO2_01_FULL_44_18 TaxID=1798407 RepID=A0A1G1ZNI7_9BACT|nr:MAG: hypothetical protein A2745_01075 [Candidatus Harrisonbacteria bacterium RIFCSPHIGHO2_01_FULL_44_13]OGY65726.1 MAG: hypothetical protein A3A16_03890 [Candidatus Harrisonbacteria bacterium RIFCSPLOWO2_01_FULL_44_18]
MEHQPKISIVEAVFLLMYLGFTDLVGIILVLFAFDDFFIIDALTFPVTQVYFRMKGVKGTADLIANVAELVPYVGALPLRTVGVLIVIWADRHPEGALAKSGQMAQMAAKVKTPKGGTLAARAKS